MLAPRALITMLLVLAGCAHQGNEMKSEPAAVAPAAPTPPVAKIVPYTVTSPNGDRVDPYYWLRDDSRSKPEVIGYLQAENDYTAAMLAHLQPAKDALFAEMVGRIQQDDSSVPYLKHGWWLYTRFEQGKEYPIHARKHGSLDAPEEVLLDANLLGAGKGFYQIGSWQPSPDGTQLVFAEDVSGRRQYVLRFKNLQTGQLWPESIANVEAGTVWANDSKTLLYVEKNPQTLLGFRVRKHVLGTDPSADAVVYEEKDSTYYMGIGKSRSDRFLWIGLNSTVATEWRYADANDPTLTFKTLLPRERDHEYQVQDHGDEFYILTNWNARNFRIMRAPIAKAGDRANWVEWVAHRDDALLSSMTVLRDHVAINERSGGLPKIRVKSIADGTSELLAFDEPAYSAFTGANPAFDTTTLRIVYTSPQTPASTYDIDLATGERKLLKREVVLGGFNRDDYVTEFRFAPARDGAQVPVTLLYRKGLKRDRSAALYQYGYGSYGAAMSPAFNDKVLSLVDRGVVYALAHIRGGEEMGRHWYEAGRQLQKKNTFNDFIDVTDFLVREGYAAKDRVVAQGGSAGGLLMGAVANMAPQNYRAIVADVPFVDVVTTMLDESIPLTTNEFDEWGNPQQKAFYDYMLSYSPYDNVAAHDYPAMLVTTGLHDSQVQYFEPAKWVAKLRATKTGTSPLLLKTNMEAGHGGKSGRFRRLEEVALAYAFFLDQLGIPVERGAGDGFESGNATAETADGFEARDAH
jgi:oligopeptidase B